ncbi:MAG: hypothetical protein R3F19_24035 [Verrucomicrobiales bacterium]
MEALQRSIYLEKVERARRMTVSERLSAGIELFEESVGRMKVGVRLRFPEADESELNQRVCDQLAQLQAWHERPHFAIMTGLEVVNAVLEALEKAEAPYMLTGSLASNVYGIARATKDADIVVDFAVANLDEIMAHMDARIHLQAQMMFETITGTTRHVLEVAQSPFKVELFHVNPDPFMTQRFARKIQADYPELGRKVWLPTAEDVVIQKLRWGREKDLSDVHDVLFVSWDGLDYAYIRKWCAMHETTNTLEEILLKLPPEIRDSTGAP